MRSEQCYVGIECEGPHQNITMLFVPGHITAKEFRVIWETYRRSVHGVYYGAGSDSEISLETFKEIKGQCKFRNKTFCMVEFVDVETKFRFVLDVFQEQLYRKIQSAAFVIWANPVKAMTTLLDDPRFGMDEVVA